MSDQTVDGIAEVIPSEPAAPLSGPTHVESADGAAPDPTGLRTVLQKNVNAVNEKLAKAATQATEEANAKHSPKAEGTPGEPLRGPDGKFLPKDAQPTTQAPPDEPPSSWRAETKALWKEIDVKFGPEQSKLLKEELRKRENDYRSGISQKDAEVAPIKSFYNDLNPILAPMMQQWQQQGVTPQQALGHLINLQTNFQRDPAGTIRWLAQTARIDLSTLTGAPQGDGKTVDPQLAPVLQELNGLRSKLHQLETGWASQTTAAATAEIQAVMDETGADGKPVRPHFNDVFQDIQAEMQILRGQHPDWSPRKITEQAYETAIWRNPQTRQKMIEGTEAQRRASEDAKQRASAAEAAAKQVRGGPPNQLNGAPVTDLRGLLVSKYNQTYGGSSRV